MESLIKIPLFLLLLSTSVFSDSKVIGRLYFNEFMGHVHKSPKKSSSSLTTIQCSQALKILEQNTKTENTEWFYVSVGEDKGYIHSQFLQSERPECFQERFPRFYQKLNLDLSDMYYFGRLQDHYFKARTKAQ